MTLLRSAGSGRPPKKMKAPRMPHTSSLRTSSGARRFAILASALTMSALAACGGSDGAAEGDPSKDTGSAVAEDNSSSDATSSDRPGGNIPVAPINNLEIDDLEAEGTMRAAMQPGDWFEFEDGFSARIESVRAAEPDEIATEAKGGGASVINVQIHYDGDEKRSSGSFFQLDTELFNQAECADKGPGQFDLEIEKGTTVDVPFCVHLTPGGYNAVTLFSYLGSNQGWGAIYAIEAPDGVTEPGASDMDESEAPGF